MKGKNHQQIQGGQQIGENDGVFQCGLGDLVWDTERCRLVWVVSLERASVRRDGSGFLDVLDARWILPTAAKAERNLELEPWRYIISERAVACPDDAAGDLVFDGPGPHVDVASAVPYGWEVSWESRRPVTRVATSRRKGARVRPALRAAEVSRGFVRVLSVQPYSETQWLWAFGEGKI